MAEDKVPSDVVELIIAVDLNPSDPEEPLNVNDVKVAPKGGDDSTDSKLVDQLLAAIAKIDPDLAYLVKDNEGNPRAAVRAIEKHAEKAPEDAQDEVAPFDKAQERKPQEKTTEDRYGTPKSDRGEFRPKSNQDNFGGGNKWDNEKPSFEPRPKRNNSNEDNSFEPKKKFGGFHEASNRAFGKKQDAEDFQDHGADEDQEDEFGNKKKKEW